MLASSLSRAADLVEVVVDQADGHGALADGRGHPFDRTAAHVAGGEPSRPVVDRTKDVPTVDIHVGERDRVEPATSRATLRIGAG